MRIDSKATGDREVRAELLRLGTMARQALDATAEEAEAYVEGQAGKHRSKGPGGGALVRSIFKRRIPDGWEIGHDLQVAPHALWVHWGSKPHLIKPKLDSITSQVRAHTRNGHPVKAHERQGKKMLRWANGGAFIFARVVKHPGYKGDAWLPRAADQAPRIFEQQLAARMKD